MTASTILFERWIIEPGENSIGEAFPDSIKVGILFVTLMLILGVNILDRNYRTIEKAIFTRITVLEKLLNIEISDIISQRFNLVWIQDFITLVYLLFVSGVLILGYVVLGIYSFIVLLVLSLFAIVPILFLSRDYVLDLFGCGYVDWILDKIECKQGDQVRIVMTNLGKEDFPKIAGSLDGEIMWKLVNQCDDANSMKPDDPKILKKGVANEELSLRYTNNYTWILETNDIEPGIYCLYRRTFDKKGNMQPKNKMVPLGRKLRIHKKPPQSEQKPTVHNVIMKKEQKTKANEIFQGRAPKSVLAKHYTGKNLQLLKQIYTKSKLSLVH